MNLKLDKDQIKKVLPSIILALLLIEFGLLIGALSQNNAKEYRGILGFIFIITIFTIFSIGYCFYGDKLPSFMNKIYKAQFVPYFNLLMLLLWFICFIALVLKQQTDCHNSDSKTCAMYRSVAAFSFLIYAAWTISCFFSFAGDASNGSAEQA